MLVVFLAVLLLAAPIAAQRASCENIGLMGDDAVKTVDTPFTLLINGKRIEKVHVDVNGAIQLDPVPTFYSNPSSKSATVPTETIGCCFGDLSSPPKPPQSIRIAYDDLTLTPNGKFPAPVPINSEGFGVFHSVSGPIGKRVWTLEWFAARITSGAKQLTHFTISFTEGVDGYTILYDSVNAASESSFIFSTTKNVQSISGALSGTKLTAAFLGNDEVFFDSKAQTFCSPCTTPCKNENYEVPEPITCSSLAIGQCNEKRYASECGFVDVPVQGSIIVNDFNTNEGEITLLMNLKFSDWKIGHVKAIEQIYDADCTDSAVNAPHACTNGLVDVKVTSFKDLPNFEPNVVKSLKFEGKGGEPVAMLYPGDSFVNFNYGDGSSLRLGDGTDKVFGQIAVRILYFDDIQNSNVNVVLRFWTACESDVASLPTYAGYLYSPLNAAPVTSFLDSAQTRTGRVPPPFITALLAREKVEKLDIKAVGISGHSWLTEAELYKIDSRGHKYLWATYGKNKDGVFQNIWTSPSLAAPMGKSQDASLSAGDFLQWDCTFESTVSPALPIWTFFSPVSDTIPSDSFLINIACDIQLVFTNSRCGGAMYDSATHKLPAPCDDPLFVDASVPEPPTQTHLVFDWRPSGACSDGSQWMRHPYHCTNQYDGGKCAFCVGRANNMESRTCIERGGMGCNAMFNTPERVSFCNMEFECPATSITFSLFVFVLLAFFGLLL